MQLYPQNPTISCPGNMKSQESRPSISAGYQRLSLLHSIHLSDGIHQVGIQILSRREEFYGTLQNSK